MRPCSTATSREPHGSPPSIGRQIRRLAGIAWLHPHDSRELCSVRVCDKVVFEQYICIQYTYICCRGLHWDPVGEGLVLIRDKVVCNMYDRCLRQLCVLMHPCIACSHRERRADLDHERFRQDSMPLFVIRSYSRSLRCLRAMAQPSSTLHFAGHFAIRRAPFLHALRRASSDSRTPIIS